MVDALGLAESDWPLASQPVLGDQGGPKALAQYWALHATLSVATHLPLPVQEALVRGVARAAQAFDKRHTRAARDFVATALGPGASPERVEELVRAGWQHLLRLAVRNHSVELVHEGERMLERFSVTMCDEARRIVAERRSALVVTGHIGDWEAGGAVLPWLGFKPLYIVSRPPRNLPLSQRFQRRRESHLVRLIPRNGAVEGITTVIGKGGYVMLMLDQRARDPFVVAPFFGRRAKCERSIGVLARRLKVPLVFFACYLTDRPYRWELTVPRVIEPRELAGLDPAAVMTLVNRELEQLILARPEQYFWLHDRFRKKKGAPAGPSAPAQASPPGPGA